MNTINKEKISKEIKLLRLNNVDIICANVHIGNEYKTEPSSEQKEIENFLYENDVDIIYMSHSYVLQPVEVKQFTKSDGTIKNVLTIYSLGNFITDQTKENSNSSAILEVSIFKNENNLFSYDYDYTPIYLDNNYSSSHKYMLLPTLDSIYDYENKLDKNISNNLYKKLQNSVEYTKKILSK